MKWYYRLNDGKVAKLLSGNQLSAKGKTESDMLADGRTIAETDGDMYNVFVSCRQSGMAAVYGVYRTAPEYVKSSALTAIKAALSAEIADLNAKYPTLGLTADDTIFSAIPKLLNSDALKAEIVYLKMLYDAVQEAGK